MITNICHKVIKTINSCNNNEQLKTAFNYYQLARKHLNNHDIISIEMELHVKKSYFNNNKSKGLLL